MQHIALPRSRIRPLGFLIAALAIVITSQVAARLMPAAPQAAGPLRVAPAGLSGAGALPADADALTTAELVAALDERIAVWARKATEQASDYISSTNLAALRLARAKLTASSDDYAAARTAVDRALDADPGYRPALQLDATLRFAVHDFTGSLARAEALLASDPSDLEALAATGDSRLELGRLDEARAAYMQLGASIAGPAVDLRLARLAWVTGDPMEAVRLARSARDAAVAADAPDVSLYQVALGEVARMAGDATIAREAYEAALAIRRDDTGALIGLARVDAAAGATDTALSRLATAVAVAPLPDALALQADLAGVVGATATANDAVATMGIVRQLAGPLLSASDRVLLRFDLDHGVTGPALVDAARASVAARPDAGGHDLLAWALHRAGRDAEALTEIDAALATGVQDARVLLHAGAIRLALGDAEGGRAALRQALQLGPALDPGERAEATALLGR